jgi:hypothetical protein
MYPRLLRRHRSAECGDLCRQPGELHHVADERGLVHLPVEEERQPDPGATSSTYSIVSVSAADAGSYSAVVSGTCGTIQRILRR